MSERTGGPHVVLYDHLGNEIAVVRAEANDLFDATSWRASYFAPNPTTVCGVTSKIKPWEDYRHYSGFEPRSLRMGDTLTITGPISPWTD